MAPTDPALAYELVAAVRTFVQREVLPVASDLEHSDAYPTDLVRQMAELGLFGAVIPEEHGGLGLDVLTYARLIEELAVGWMSLTGVLNSHMMAATLVRLHGTDDQRRRFLPPIVRNEEVWCQLFSEPAAGSDLASLATRATRDGDRWIVTGQKVWTTWAHRADRGVLLARTDLDVPKRDGITYFLLDLHQAGVEVRPLRHIGCDVDFNEVFLDGAIVPDEHRVGEVGAGWKVANATLSGEWQMVSGAGSGGVDRIGGLGVEHLLELARRSGRVGDPVVRQDLMRVLSEERIRAWTNQRVRAQIKAGRAPGPESSIGKVHQGGLNQRVQLLATSLLGMGAIAWTGDLTPPEVRGMLRSRANTIEGGTTEINKNVLGERVLGLPREPDPWRGAAWRETPH